MNNEHLLKILKHNLEVMPSRIYCPVVESENIGGAYREGYEQALDDVKEQVEGIIEDEEITWLSQHDDRITGLGWKDTSSLERFNDPTKPWLGPSFERCEEEIHEQLKESIDHTLEKIAEKRVNEDIPEKLREIADKLDEGGSGE